MRLSLILPVIALLTLGACSTTDEASKQDSEFSMQDRDGTESGEFGTEGAMDEMYTRHGPPLGTQEDLDVNVGDRVFFGYDRYDLSPEARSTLELQAQWLKQYPDLTVTIEGHADERGTREYNLALGERRANAARNYLVALGVDPRRLSVVSYGKERPAVLGSNPSAWAQNRRAVTVIN